MAGAAGLFGKQLLASDNWIDVLSRGPGKPRSVIGRLHDGDPAAHDGVVCAAILRTEKFIASRFGGTEPHGVVVAGHDVHLHAECRNVKVVDDVFPGEHELDVAADGNMPVVDLAGA